MDRNFGLGVSDQAEFVESTRRFTIGDLLHKRSRMDPEGIAVSVPGRDITYQQLEERVHRLSNALIERGCKPGVTTFAILSENRPEFIEILYTGAMMGCLVAAQNWRLERTELIHCVDTVDPEVVFVSRRHYEKTGWIEDTGDADPEYIVFDEVDSPIGTTVAYEELLESGAPHPPDLDSPIHPEQGFVVMYTSGTTGMPKGAVVSHRAEFARTNQVILDYGLEKGDSYPSWAPMFHMGGIDWVITTAVLGGTYYPIDGFDADRIIEVLQTAEQPLSWLILFPGMIERLLDGLQETSTDSDDYGEIRTIGALLDLVNPETLAKITEILDTSAQNTYGSTETGHITSGNTVPPGVVPDERRLRKVESPYIQVKLVDEDREPVEKGETGEVAVRGPPLFSGYLAEPEANHRDFEDGWFFTGDIMNWNGDDTYSYLNRRKYMIKSGGENVYPAEIEDVLITHELVEDVCVVKMPDDKWGEVPRAVVGSSHPDELSAAELLELVKSQLANYKLPHYIEFVDPEEFPRNTTGKIIREDVEDWPVSSEDRVRKV